MCMSWSCGESVRTLTVEGRGLSVSWPWPRARRVSRCSRDLVRRARWMCFTIISIAIVFSIPRGTSMSAID